MTFDEIAPIVDRSPVAAHQLASRARRRIRTRRRARPATCGSSAALSRRSWKPCAKATSTGCCPCSIRISCCESDGSALAGATRVVRGAKAVPGQAEAFSKVGLSEEVVLVNGNIGLVERLADGRLFAVIGFTIANGRIAEMNILADPERLRRLDLSTVEGH